MMLIIAIILFVLLVVIHEYGHFLMAKKHGVEVEEFGIGFPPRIAGKKLGKGIFEGYYSINWLPLGGFVKLKGENDSATSKGSYGSKSFSQKVQILLAGVVANFLTAILIFSVLAAVGMPKLVDNQFSYGEETLKSDDVSIAYVEPESPADLANLKVGDNIVSIGERTVTDVESVSEIAETYKGQTIEVRITRGDQVFDQAIQLNDSNESGYLGVTPIENQHFTYGWASPVVGVGLTGQLSWLTLDGLGSALGALFTGDTETAGESVAGPIGIFSILNSIGAFGFSYLLYFIAVISLTLGIMNALPIPALDGGRVFVSGMFKLFKKPLTKDLEQKIHGTGFAILLFLILLVSIADVNRFL